MENFVHFDLPNDDMQKLISDFERGRAAMTDELNTKLYFWETLPWKLAALGHHDTIVARREAASILAQWADMNHDPAGHHPITIEALGSEAKVAQVTAFIDGALLSETGDLYGVVAKLRFTPINERTIEGRFSSATQSKQWRKVGPSYIPTALRVPMWESEVKRSASVLDMTVSEFERCRKRQCLPQLLGLERAPLVAEALASEPNSKRRCQDLRQRVSHTVYCYDIPEQYRPYKKARKQHDRRRDKVDRMRKVVGGIPRRAFNIDTIFEKALLEHFRRQASVSENTVYSMDMSIISGVELADGRSKRATAFREAPGGCRVEADVPGALDPLNIYEDEDFMCFSVLRKS
eukprot:9498967-Pyramimonas_sp.AAC.1